MMLRSNHLRGRNKKTSNSDLSRLDCNHSRTASSRTVRTIRSSRTLLPCRTQTQVARAQLQVDLSVFANTNATLVAQQQYIVHRLDALEAAGGIGTVQAMEHTLANFESQLQLFASDIAWIKRHMVAAVSQPTNLIERIQRRAQRIRSPMPEGRPQGAEQDILTPTTVGYESLPVSAMSTPRAAPTTQENEETEQGPQHHETPNLEDQPERSGGNGDIHVVEASDESDEDALVATLATSVTPS